MKSRVRSMTRYVESIAIWGKFLLVVVSLLSPGITAFLSWHAAYAGDDPFQLLKDETLSYFRPVTGEITQIEDGKAIINLGIEDSVKEGMRFNIFFEEAPFSHPVTKEPLGYAELLTGKLEIKKAEPDQSRSEVIEGEAKEGYKVRISEIKVRMLFCQSSDVDWNFAEYYYRILKETGRFTMLDTDIEMDDPSKAVEEARKRGADIALLLTAVKRDSDTFVKQRLFWASDGLKFFETDIKIDAAFAKELSYGKEFLMPFEGEALLRIDTPLKGRLVTTGDVDGDKKQELIISTEDEVRIFSGVQLQPALGGIKIKTPARNNHLWLDLIDLNRNGRDEIIITSLRDNGIVSYIYEYELEKREFVLLYEDAIFLRRLDDRLLAQSYSPSTGYDGKVFIMVYEDKYKRGEEITLPPGVNIYDFTYVDDLHGGRLVISYDENGSLHLYDENNMRLWESKATTGGFLKNFKKSSPTVMIDRGEWSVKDRLLALGNKRVLYVKRIPVLGLLKGLGYKNSQVNSLWWNGLSVEKSVLIDNIKGTLLDFTVMGDKVVVLANPLLGIKTGNILKGENPLGTVLYVYSVKGL
ncbi:MAG: hypothetical protein AB1390_08890 [Nitrospirota bacterium]